MGQAILYTVDCTQLSKRRQTRFADILKFLATGGADYHWEGSIRNKQGIIHCYVQDVSFDDFEYKVKEISNYLDTQKLEIECYLLDFESHNFPNDWVLIDNHSI